MYIANQRWEPDRRAENADVAQSEHCLQSFTFCFPMGPGWGDGLFRISAIPIHFFLSPTGPFSHCLISILSSQSRLALP